MASSHFVKAQITVIGTPDGIASEGLSTLTLSDYEVPSGTDRLLLVVVSSGDVPLGVSFGGIPMVAQGGGLNLWALTLGTDMVDSDLGDIVFNIAAPSAFLGFNVIAFSGVDQSNPLENYQSMNILPLATSSSLTILSNNDDLIFDAIVVGCAQEVGLCDEPPLALQGLG